MAYGASQRAFGPFPRLDPEAGRTVLEPDAPGRGWWVGAPSVVVDRDDERILLCYRRRRPRGLDDERGFRFAVAASTDGLHFEDLWSVTKAELHSTSIERGCLHQADDGRWRLYLSYEHPSDGRWRIDVVEADRPDGFDVATARSVLTPEGTGTDAVKDPVVVRVGPALYMLVSTFLTISGPAPTSLAVSLDDGRSFDWLGPVFDVGSGWDRYQARLGSVLRLETGFLGFYDGAGHPSEDTEERCGVALSADLRRWERLSLDGPWLTSPHGTGSLRYVDAVPWRGEWWCYYEYARADGSHELRLNRLSL